jgi:uncharacterized protein YgiM (DUF1202 family)
MTAGRNRARRALIGCAVRLVAFGAVVAVGLGACGSSGKHAAATTLPTTPTTRPALPTAPTTIPLVQLSGARTVLSPVGLNVRAQPSKSAKVLGTASQGTVLDVLRHTTAGGGWYEVKGATVTGWILDRLSLSAPGRFADYSSGQFAVLYPATWTHASSSPNTVTFAPRAAGESIVVRTAASVTPLGRGRTGYRQTAIETAVACGITTDLRTYTEASTTAAGSPAAGRYLAQIRVTLDAHHALGIDANLGFLSELQSVRDFINSVTFPFPQCEG